MESIAASHGVRCAIVGSRALTVECAEIALDHGLEIVVIATEHPMVAEFARARGISSFDSSGDVAKALLTFDFDVLLSIANLRILNNDVLEQAPIRINYHDGPLPDYAGVNVTTWAISDGVRRHGITWHQMAAVPDAGDVFAAVQFDLAPDETALSLNARCHEAAAASFHQIAAALAIGNLHATTPGATPTRVCLRHVRPCVVFDPRWGAETVERQVRAHAVGPRIRNTVGSVRIAVGEEIYVLEQVRVEPATNGASPGDVVSIEDDAVRIRVADGDVVVTAMAHPDGTLVAIGQAMAENGRSVGDTVDAIDEAVMSAMRELDPELSRREDAWSDRLSRIEVVPLPLVRGASESSWDSLEVAVPPLADIDAILASVAVWIARATSTPLAVFGYVDDRIRQRSDILGRFAHVPIGVVDVEDRSTFDSVAAAVATERAWLGKQGAFLRDLVGREPATRGRVFDTPVVVAVDGGDPRVATRSSIGNVVWFVMSPAGDRLALHHRIGAIDRSTALRIASAIETILERVTASPTIPLRRLEIVGKSELAELDAMNRTELDHDRSQTIDAQFWSRVALDPHAPALTSGNTTLTYGEVADAASALADRLRACGVHSGDRVGNALPRGAEMVIGVLATLMCGAAYLPLDPTYPDDRLRFMVDDSGIIALLADPDAEALLQNSDLPVIDPANPYLDPLLVAAEPNSGPATHTAQDLAYVIYTSGSTGVPKGVMLEHRNVVNFFAAMDDVIDHEEPGVWLAVTSLSFDISVLELLWTLTRGFHVVLKSESGVRSGLSTVRRSTARPGVNLSLWFRSDRDDQPAGSKRLVLECARSADRDGFEAVWILGASANGSDSDGENPSVIAAAIAAATDRVHVRVAGALDEKGRVTDEWAIVEELAGRRTAVVLATSLSDTRHGIGPTELEPIRTPGQRIRAVWIESIGPGCDSVGTAGLNLLTPQAGRSTEQVADDVRRYRAAWVEAGHRGAGRVTVLLQDGLEASFDTTQDAVAGLELLAEVGVDEIACVIDLSAERNAVTRSLEMIRGAKGLLDERAEMVAREADDGRPSSSVAELVAAYGVTHLQCTPSLAAMVLADGADRVALGSVRHLMVGGEALPTALAAELRGILPHRFTNMYGPTETTIWSLVHEIDSVPDKSVPIGLPIANNTIFVLDSEGRRQPIGVFGELYIGGEGVARGYHGRDELTASRFVEFAEYGRIYATGDVVRVHPDGYVEFAGRSDNQVKIRGHRIELGEIETVLDSNRDVVQSVVVARGDVGDPRLIAFVIAAPGTSPTTEELRAHVAESLPDVMVPSAVAVVESFPLTPNGKIDRKALPEVGRHTPRGSTVEHARVTTDVSDQLRSLWIELLGVRDVNDDDDFFDLGGHSLTAVRLMSRIDAELGVRLQLATLFETPTFEALSRRVQDERPEIGAITSARQITTMRQHLVPISTSGVEEPLYVVHGAGGNVLFLWTLARALGGERPIYGFQAHGTSGNDMPDATIEAMATRYVAELIEHAPGPYLLGGFSGGGLVALEMVKQLQELGRSVRRVVLFDTFPSGVAPPGPWKRKVQVVANARERGLRALRPYVKSVLQSYVRRYASRFSDRSSREEQDRALGYVESNEEGFVNLFYYFSAIADRYVTGTYDVDVALLQADCEWPVHRWGYGWDAHVRGRIVVRTAPGDHHTMFYPQYAPTLARVVSEVLSDSS